MSDYVWFLIAKLALLSVGALAVGFFIGAVRARRRQQAQAQPSQTTPARSDRS